MASATLKIYWYETGVLSTAKSVAAKARSAASKTAATAQRAASNQAQAQARQGSGKSAAQNRAEFVAAQKKAGGRDLSVTLSENLRFSDSAQPAVQYRRQVGRDEGGGRPPTTQEQVIQSQSRVQGVPVEQITKRKGEAKSVELREGLSFGEQEQRPSNDLSPYDSGLAPQGFIYPTKEKRLPPAPPLKYW